MREQQEGDGDEMTKPEIREMTVEGPATVLWGLGTSRYFVFGTYPLGNEIAIRRAKQFGIACASIPEGRSMSFPVPFDA